MTDGIVEFIKAQLAEDQAIIKAMGVEGAGRWWVGQRFDGSLDPNGSTVFVDVRRSDGLGYIHLGAPGMFTGPTATHIARHDPATVLAGVAATRAILAEHKHVPATEPSTHGFGCQICAYDRGDCVQYGWGWCNTVRLLAAPYASRPGFKDEWRLA